MCRNFNFVICRQKTHVWSVTLASLLASFNLFVDFEEALADMLHIHETIQKVWDILTERFRTPNVMMNEQVEDYHRQVSFEVEKVFHFLP
jgi:hypothetical protein